MIREFEGKTEQEAIAKAMAELGLDENEFDVEVMEEAKKGLFTKGKVKIRIHVEEEGEPIEADYEADPELERKLCVFVETVVQKMGFAGRVSVSGREGSKLFLDLTSADANLLIGKHGKNLDSLQVLVNVYAGNLADEDQKSLKVVLDSENYRNRREDHLVRLAIKTAQQVRRTRTSRLLEPMNPFERRLIHTALGDMDDIHTESEGEGLIKQVRVSYVER
ncbi:MAG TPA: RNA-binding cell elongation regulator Jag/EloR [Spirochaetia bacterium]|nr:RNA-binding cell elongation regulator Jag/EloR [Spirochaetia bacterium]